MAIAGIKENLKSLFSKKIRYKEIINRIKIYNKNNTKIIVNFCFESSKKQIFRR